ncbi:MAG: hypothetical protein FWD18_07995 [Micrococcales bacterium]|nr:hypothetical protein [Micrococcales bacterium]
MLVLVAFMVWWTRPGPESGNWWGPDGPPWNTEVDGEEPTAWESYEDGSAILRETAQAVGLDVEIEERRSYYEEDCFRHDDTMATSFSLESLRHVGAVDSMAVAAQVAEYWNQRGVAAPGIHTAPPTDPAVDATPEMVRVFGRAPLGATLVVSIGKIGTSFHGESWCALVSGAPAPFSFPTTYVTRPPERVGYVNSLLKRMSDEFDFTLVDTGLQQQPCYSDWTQISAGTWTLASEKSSDQILQDVIAWWSKFPLLQVVEINSSQIDVSPPYYDKDQWLITITRTSDGGIQATGRSGCFADPAR